MGIQKKNHNNPKSENPKSPRTGRRAQSLGCRFKLLFFLLLFPRIFASMATLLYVPTSSKERKENTSLSWKQPATCWFLQGGGG